MFFRALIGKPTNMPLQQLLQDLGVPQHLWRACGELVRRKNQQRLQAERTAHQQQQLRRQVALQREAAGLRGAASAAGAPFGANGAGRSGAGTRAAAAKKRWPDEGPAGPRGGRPTGAGAAAQPKRPRTGETGAQGVRRPPAPGAPGAAAQPQRRGLLVPIPAARVPSPKLTEGQTLAIVRAQVAVVRKIAKVRQDREAERVRDVLHGFLRSAEFQALPLGSKRCVWFGARAARTQRVRAKVRAEVDGARALLESQSTKERNRVSRYAPKLKEGFLKQTARLRQQRADKRATELKQAARRFKEMASYGRDRLAVRNKKVLAQHGKMGRDFLRAREKEEQAAKMQALAANDMEAYRRLLQSKGSSQAGNADAKSRELFTFLAKTEAYIANFKDKIEEVKVQQRLHQAVAEAVEKARGAGATAGDLGGVAAAAEARALEAVRQEAAGRGGAERSYYDAAHAIEEDVMVTPALLSPHDGATLREYQLVGLQWMISLYNNDLNGILADEMGLGKTVQVMALFAYLMEKKDNCGPHLVLVPNAVLINWREELTKWLPSFKHVFFVGEKDARARIFSLDVQPMQFNVLVTTFDYVMKDRSKLGKIQWQYLVIDEAHRMKDSESKLNMALSNFKAKKRLLLTGTPLQNDITELWSLLNLLLPTVFDDAHQFKDWFGNAADDDWLAKDKRIVVIHRLHQILEPFMLRRQLQDVEGKLPPKVQHIVKCAMSAEESAAYKWVQGTGTMLVDPDGLRRPGAKMNDMRYVPLNSRVMELRKICNHMYLAYPPAFYGPPAAAVWRSCKMAVLDRLLVKLFKSGHRVLLFSTMTKTLDIIGQYLQWRVIGGQRMKFLRIDGGTSLGARDEAIRQFNRPDSDIFIFLLSIRAAGRGLNLQTADTVVMYDPDPNPKSEEQAMARAHRIGQTREVRVFHLEAVSRPHYVWEETEAAARARGGPVAYKGSYETVIRNEIQQQKIEMASELIDAGRFDGKTTDEERKKSLEEILEEHEQNEAGGNFAPTWPELNKMIARSEEEEALFNALDAEEAWPADEGRNAERGMQFLNYSKAEFAQAQSEYKGKSRLAKVQLDADEAAALKKATPLKETLGVLGPRVRSRGNMNLNEEHLAGERAASVPPGPAKPAKPARPPRVRDRSKEKQRREERKRAKAQAKEKKKKKGGMGMDDYRALLERMKAEAAEREALGGGG